MKIHEYQAKELFAKFGLPVPRGIATDSAEGAARAFAELGAPLSVVKAQIHAGGRGKAGGVKLCRSADEARAAAAAMLGKPLVTHQTGPEGRIVETIYVEEGSEIARELYVAIAVDRTSFAPVLMASAEGGMDIEELAAERPEAIVRERIHPSHGLQGFQLRRVAKKLGWEGATAKSGMKVLAGLAKLMVDLDCSIAEINPLIVTKQNQLLALDAKMVFDSNALFRHKDVMELRDLDEEDAKEIEASKFDLSYIALDGNIGCMVNGAGLAMATMDVIGLYGGSPANFLDVGGGATAEKVTAAFRILLGDAKVKGVLVNIFGGIMKCDVIATGVITAARQVDLKVPLVVRLEGTTVELGRKMLAESGLPIVSGTDLDDAAQKICAAVAAGK
jgi:succinyl-CoA synthetase beta subunit